MEMYEAVEVLLDHGNTPKDIAESLRITPGMVSHHKKKENMPSLKTAALVWGIYGMQVEPYTDKALMIKYRELTDDDTTTTSE